MKKIIILAMIIMGLTINTYADNKETNTSQENAGWNIVASQTAPDGETQITFENGMDITLYPDKAPAMDAELNPEKLPELQAELDKLPTETKKELIDAGVQIYIQDDLKTTWKEGVFTYGVYFWETNAITLDAEKESIEKATLHEVGHALDDIHDLSYNDLIKESYEEKEIGFSNPHFESSIQEYVAECVLHFYKGDLAEDTKIFKALDSVLWR